MNFNNDKAKYIPTPKDITIANVYLPIKFPDTKLNWLTNIWTPGSAIVAANPTQIIKHIINHNLLFLSKDLPTKSPKGIKLFSAPTKNKVNPIIVIITPIKNIIRFSILKLPDITWNIIINIDIGNIENKTSLNVSLIFKITPPRRIYVIFILYHFILKKN